MHIEPGIVNGTRMALGYGTAAAAFGGTAMLAIDFVREKGIGALVARSILAGSSVFVFFEVFFQYPAGVSEVHLILGTSLLLIFGAAAACQQKIETACNEMTADSSVIQSVSRNSCIQSNKAEHYYHENWNVLVKRVACPTHLTEVTGCKPGGQDSLPAPDPNVQTAAQAASAGFFADLDGAHYHTTTMQDCCMPTCAWSNNVNIDTLDGYNSFYSCDADGAPITK